MDTLIPEADVVVTEALKETASALRHVVAAGGVMNIDGAPGVGKTVALQYALSRLPPGPNVCRVPIPVGATVSQLRHAIAEALALKVRPANRYNTTDQALATALRSPHVLVYDDIQRLSPPALEYLCRLAADPGAPTTLVLAGTGSTQALQRIPELASRILTRQHIPPLTPAQVQAVLPAYHPLWGKVPGEGQGPARRRAAVKGRRLEPSRLPRALHRTALHVPARPTHDKHHPPACNRLSGVRSVGESALTEARTGRREWTATYAGSASWFR
ncbi:AAA family ATPase [Streptomyces sp. NPDC088748]|uniref:AAA family ATPase n=1 Tax=Streptomyces sp. NPDC088748 TaxID=3365887 RepID=UPI00382A1077